MNESIIGIPIPFELKEHFNTDDTFFEESTEFHVNNKPLLRTIRDKDGLFSSIEYYNLNKELNKKIYFLGGSITKIERFKNGKLIYSKEYNPENGKLSTINSYSGENIILSQIKFSYSRDNRIQKITKIIGNESYGIEYNYDQLYRVNSRKIIINNKIVDEEIFKFDILEKIVEYSNHNLFIYVFEHTKDSKLGKYKIIYKNNELIINNRFNSENEYTNSEIILNNTKTIKRDIKYLDNIYLKRPYTSPEDVDFIISRYLSSNDYTNNNQVKNLYNESIGVLPISIRKLKLCKMAANY